MSIKIEAARERLRSLAGVIIEKTIELVEIKRGLPRSRREAFLEDLDADPSVATEMRAVIDCVLQDYLNPAVRDLRAAADYQLLKRRGVLLPDSEETRKKLYDLVVRDNFTSRESEDPDGESFPPYTPEEAGLRVFFEHGRWFATWLKLEEPEDLPEMDRRELLVLTEAPDEGGRLIYQGV